MNKFLWQISREEKKDNIDWFIFFFNFRQCTGPQFQICGDLDPHQINVVRRTWKQVGKYSVIL